MEVWTKPLLRLPSKLRGLAAHDNMENNENTKNFIALWQRFSCETGCRTTSVIHPVFCERLLKPVQETRWGFFGVLLGLHESGRLLLET